MTEQATICPKCGSVETLVVRETYTYPIRGGMAWRDPDSPDFAIACTFCGWEDAKEPPCFEIGYEVGSLTVSIWDRR